MIGEILNTYNYCCTWCDLFCCPVCFAPGKPEKSTEYGCVFDTVIQTQDTDPRHHPAATEGGDDNKSTPTREEACVNGQGTGDSETKKRAEEGEGEVEVVEGARRLGELVREREHARFRSEVEALRKEVLDLKVCVETCYFFFIYLFIFLFFPFFLCVCFSFRFSFPMLFFSP